MAKPKIKFRKGVNVGQLAAENDSMLATTFVDQGHLKDLQNCAGPKSILIGRTGSGKTALVKTLIDECEYSSSIDPEMLSMQYLSNSGLLRDLLKSGVKLDIFYRFLWKHVCILELIRMRYKRSEDVPGVIDKILSYANIKNKKQEQEAYKASTEYISKYADQYWISSDTRIKSIVSEVENKVAAEGSLKAEIRALASASSKISASQTEREAKEVEIVERAQSIVNDFLISDLNQILRHLSDSSFQDDQKPHFILIDDLDNTWLPDNELYLDLIKALLWAVSDLNKKIKNVKVIVSLRENIYNRAFTNTKVNEPQREKWQDVVISLRWSKSELLELIDKRLALAFRGLYTNEPPTLEDLLSGIVEHKGTVSARDFVIERTHMRPRDIIDFVNTCLEVIGEETQQGAEINVTQKTLARIEKMYSSRRTESLIDEWKDNFPLLESMIGLLRGKNHSFSPDDIADDEFDKLCGVAEKLEGVQSNLLEALQSASYTASKQITLDTLFLCGVIGYKDPATHKIEFIFDRRMKVDDDLSSKSVFQVHKMFWSHLNIRWKSQPN